MIIAVAEMSILQTLTAFLSDLRRGRLIATYTKVGLIPKASRVLPLKLFTQPRNYVISFF
jgi:hypothetical protein